MKKAIEIKTIIFVILTILILLCGCANNLNKEGEKEMPKPQIIYLNFNYSGGMELESNYDYLISMDDDGYHLQASLNSGNTQIEKEISKNDYENLVKLFDEVDLASWDGNNVSNGEIGLDVARFTFTVSFSDGTKCTAHSLTNSPEGYIEAAEKFKLLFRQMIREAKTIEN